VKFEKIMADSNAKPCPLTGTRGSDSLNRHPLSLDAFALKFDTSFDVWKLLSDGL
jgi:hypothetical protein